VTTRRHANADAVRSPCIGVCRMVESSGLCEGCLRTIAEIAAWATLDDPAKLEVWVLLSKRRRDWRAERLNAIKTEP
jgi:predicted Fe-S protein YdhL (DUF1289 family)